MSEPTAEEIDALRAEMADKVDAWHESDSDLTLPEWCGLSVREYAEFAAEPREWAKRKLGEARRG